jgi:hypothetical protein
MKLLQKMVLALGVVAAIGVIYLDILVVWQFRQASQNPGRVLDMQLLIVLLFGIAGLYSILFLLMPYVAMQILKHESKLIGHSVQKQLRTTISELAELREQTAVLVRDRALPAPVPLVGREVQQLTGRVKAINSDMALVHRALADVLGANDLDTARQHIGRALSMSPEPDLKSEIHYTFACVLARHGEYREAAQNLREALERPNLKLEAMLARDIEEGGRLYEFACLAPYDAIVNRYLLEVSIGA